MTNRGKDAALISDLWARVGHRPGCPGGALDANSDAEMPCECGYDKLYRRVAKYLGWEAIRAVARRTKGRR